jgi:ketosteroid isomerase-like protein
MARTKSKLQAAALGGTPDEVEAAFYEGLRSGDLEKVMACWADEEDIACIHPGGVRLLGVASIRAAFEAMFANGGVIPVSPEHIHRVEALASAVHHVSERLEVSTPQGMVTAYVPATNVYHRTAQGWRMVVHHASPGTTEAALGMGQKPQVLH